jgi:hypothetical protein
MIPDDVLAVAGVVLGEDTAHLTGWQMRHALAAMTALGQSRKHMAWALETSEQMVWNVCREIGVRPHARDQVIDFQAVEFVVGGDTLTLKDETRNEAIRQMAQNGVRLDVIAKRLGEPMERIRLQAKRLGFDLSTAPAPFDWDRVLKTATASLRRLEGGNPDMKTRRPVLGRRVQRPTAQQRTTSHDHRMTDHRQDAAA